MVSADPSDAFTFDLEYTSAAGILEDASDGTVPSMQMAFQYSILVPHDGTAAGSPQRCGWLPFRVLH